LQYVPSSQTLLDEAPVIDRTRLFFGSRVVESPVVPAALSITRYDLDAQLWSAAQAAGATTLSNCEVTGISGDGPFQLQTSLGAMTAKAIVIAAGRWSQFTPDRTMPPGPKWMGVKGHFREAIPNSSTDLYFFAEGYCGVQSVAKDVVNACAMVRSDRATSIEQVLALHPKLSARAANWTPMMQPISTAPLIYRRPQPVRENVLFAGDAAAFMDPFVGDGVSIALRGGRVAATCICQFLSGELTLRQSAERYTSEYSRRFAPLLSAASHMRSLFSLPETAKAVAFELLRLPGVMPFVIRKTRQAA
jgi:2-polyprenyl-6-methoxyphenol hydroxylase-like FAD-dependent oxidoreductase